MKVVEIVGIVLAIGLAIWAMIAIGNELGWTPTGTAIAVIYFVLETAYAIALFALGTVFPVGTIIAVVIGLIDLITGWIFGTGAFQWLLQQIIKLFVWLFSDMRIRSEVNLAPINIDVSYGDIDNNGIDVGDEITYTTRFYSNVTITGDGSSSDLADSYLVPTFTTRAPSGSNAHTWSSTTNETPITTSTKKSTIYNSSATIKPDQPMVNFPMAISLTTDYKVYYSDCWWFFGWWCDRESQSGSNNADWTTLYTDVMPGTIDGFATWRALKSNDPDGDGLTDDQEQANGTAKWAWDSDGDGLGDKYELQVGTDPLSSDSDGDGLNDFCEFTTGSNPLIKDTDSDGLSDNTECTGWVIPIDFCNQTFYKVVNSDPRFNDTDSDGLDDYIEWAALLNPGSSDTNGDWENDQFIGYWMGEITYDTTLEFPDGWTAQVLNARVTPEGDILVLFENCSFIKYAPDGNVIWIRELEGMSDVDSSFCIDSRGYIYLTEWIEIPEFFVYDHEMNFCFSSYNIDAWNLLAVDEENNLIYAYGSRVVVYDLDSLDPLYIWSDYWAEVYGMDLLMNKDPIFTAFISSEDEVVAVCSPEGDSQWTFGHYGYDEGEFSFGGSGANIDVLGDDFLAVADTGNSRVQMFAPGGRFLASFGSGGSGNDSFDSPRGIDHDAEHLYVTDYNNNRVQVLNYRLFLNNTQLNVTFEDTDGDGLTDANETAGWNITVTTQFGGTTTYHVTSEPNATDSDNDRLNDTREFNLGCDPRLVDTDGDGLSDAKEAKLGTDPAHWDTDGDGLDDAAELSFLSDPLLFDTDGDGLNDSHEFDLGSSPVMPDTDQDGLLDHEEFMLGANLTNPDSDGDFMLDGEEGLQGTDPNGGDSDSDGLSDGYEGLYGTAPLNGDSDGDGLPDGFETSKHMNPLSNDTDGDGLLDGDEMARGLNPFSGDTDGDGVPDALDTDYLLGLVGDIILVADPVAGLEDFMLELSAEANVTLATPQDLLANHTAERNIVLVGKPGALPGTAGAMIGDLLADTGEVYDQMLNSNILHSAVRYGVWAPTQTVIMLSGISDYDAKSVLGTFKSQTVTLIGNSISFRYLNNRSCFMLDDLNTGKAADSAVMAKLDSMALFNVTVTKHGTSTTPATLDHQNGLGAGEMAVGKYLEIAVDQDIEENILGAHVELYYTAQDLDRTGDGDADDPEDFNETTLALYRFDEFANNWTKLSPALDWVNDTGVNTTDIVRYGTQYSGFIWADVTNLSLFGIGGRISAPPTEAVLSLNPGWNLFSFPVIYPVINGTAIACADDLATATGCTMLSIWNASSQQYINYIPGFNLPTDPENFAIPEDGAVFVWMDGGSALMLNVSGYAPGMRSVHLLPGWNTVGYMRDASAVITLWAGQVSCGIYDDICWYDGTTFIHHIFQTDEMQLVPGRGYFIWSDEDIWLNY